MATATAPVRTKTKFSSQARSTTSKLIQNLGSNKEQYSFNQKLRTVYGRD